MPEKFTRGRADIYRTTEGYKVDVVTPCSNCPENKDECPLFDLKGQVEQLDGGQTYNTMDLFKIRQKSKIPQKPLEFEISGETEDGSGVITKSATCWRIELTEVELEAIEHSPVTFRNLEYGRPYTRTIFLDQEIRK